MSGTFVESTYPLAAGSRARRRRMLCLLGSTPPLSRPQLPARIEEPDDEADAEDLIETAVLDPAGPSCDGLSLSDLEPTIDRSESGIDESGIFETGRSTLPIKPPSFQPIKRLLASSQPATWVFTGDGVTHGGRQTHGLRNYVEHFSERVRAELGRAHDVVINTGVCGQTSADLLEHLEWQALRFLPDVVSVTIGLEDAHSGPAGRQNFRDNIRRIIGCILDAGALPLLHTPHRIDLDDAPSMADLRAYVKILRDAALEFDVPCIDHWAHWKKIAVQTHLQRGWLAEDNLHPGALGHQEIARLIFRRLSIFDEDSGVCRETSTIGLPG